MPGVNKVILVGHIQKVPEIIYPNENDFMVKLILETVETVDRSNGKFEYRELHIILMTSKLAETAIENLMKGDYAYIQGKIKTRSSIDTDNKKHYVAEIYANNYTLLFRNFKVS